MKNSGYNFYNIGQVQMPASYGTFQQAQKIKPESDTRQGKLEI